MRAVSTSAARRLQGSSGSALLGDLSTLTDGHVLTVQADGTIAPEAAAASGVGGATGSTDNALLRADGTGGATVQSSGITVADAASGVAEMSAARVVRGVRTISSSPDTQLASDDLLFFAAALTVDLLTSCTTGRGFTYVCTTAATLTLDPGGTDTINGGSAGTALAIPCAAGQQVEMVRSAAGAWRAVLPGQLNGFRLSIVDAVLYVQPMLFVGNTASPVGSRVAVTTTADANAFGATLSGTSLVVNAATAVAGNNCTTAQSWSFELAAIGLTIPNAARIVRLIMSVSSFSEGARTASSVSSVGVALGTSATAAIRTGAFLRPGSGSSWNWGRISGASTYSSLSGSATAVKFDEATTIQDVTSVEDVVYRFASDTDVENGTGGPTTGGISASAPTHAMLYVQVTGANTLASWTLTDLTVDVRW